MDRATKQTGSWMWSRNLSERPLPVSQIHTAAVPAAASSYGYESWEERAFAEDSAGRLGACIWPPRSYTCSFCRREFRSAQALGGHMNVHRRDRARLNQSWSDINSGDSDHDDRHQNSDSKPIPYCSDPDSPLFPRVSALTSTPEVSIYALFSHSCSSPIIQESQVESCFTTTGSSMDPVAARQVTTPGLKLSSESLNRRDLDNDDDHDEIGKKRRRRTDVMFDISMRSSSAIQQKLQTEVFKLSPCPVEELDLELRLGCYSKVSQKRKACCG